MASKIKTTTKKVQPIPTFEEAINRYYKLKSDYDQKIQKITDKIIANTMLSSSEKHEKFLTEKKKCIVCGKSGGTIFHQKGNLLTAKCGNLETPCRLDIQLQRAKYMNIMSAINLQQDLVNSHKANIIDIKLDFLFGFNNQQVTLTNFNATKNLLVDTVKQYQKVSEKFLNITSNSSNREKINSLTDALQAEIIKFKDLIKNYEESGTLEFLKDAVESYVNKISVMANDLRKLKYQEEYVYNEIQSFRPSIKHIVQNSYKPSELEIIVPGTENKIISFIY